LNYHVIMRHSDPPPGELLVPLPFARDQLPPVSQFRSTWLVSSLNAVRDRGLMDAYLRGLAPSLHDTLTTMVAGSWVPIAVAVAHYTACDRLPLTPSEQTEMGRGVSRHAKQTLLSTAVRLAAHALPGTSLAQLPRLWGRMFVGGGTAVYKLGPKDARIEMIAGPLAGIGYFKNGLRGVLLGVGELFSSKVYVLEIPRLCNATTIVFRTSWV
jgi:hypothetical protein